MGGVMFAEEPGERLRGMFFEDISVGAFNAFIIN
jgi:hypothetical protein